MSAADRAALVAAAEHGNLAAVELMLELGFPIDARREATDDDGATALHAAAWAGSSETVALLLERGADLTARDTRWQSQPLEWALVGSGEAPRQRPVARLGGDRDAAARRRRLAGRSHLGPDDPKQPSAAVLELLRSRGFATDTEA